MLIKVTRILKIVSSLSLIYPYQLRAYDTFSTEKNVLSASLQLLLQEEEPVRILVTSLTWSPTEAEPLLENFAKLTTYTNLKTFTYTGNDLKNEHLNYLIGHPCLKELRIKSCKRITPDMLWRLKQANPNLKIFWWMGQS